MKHLVSQPHIIFSVQNGSHPDKATSNISHEQALAALNFGLEEPNAHSVKGKYGAPEESIFVSKPTKEQIDLIDKMANVTGQDTVLRSDGKDHTLVPVHSKEPIVRGSGTVWHDKEPEDYYTTLPTGEHFTHNLGNLEKSDKGNDKVRGIADSYAAQKGIKLQHGIAPVKVNEDRAAKIAQAYDQMPHQPNHPAVKRAYGALIGETLDQFKHLKNNGLKISRIEPGMANPYKTSKDAHDDVKNNNHLWYFPTESGFGSNESIAHDHPMLAQTGETHNGKPLLANDVFRIVHDYFGHAKEGHGFGPMGEENAYQNHMQMYSPEAQKALTTETRGQNSWVNFGPHGKHNRANPNQTVYADQKAGLMPDWTMEKSDVTMSKEDFIKEHKKLVGILKNPTKEKLAEEAADQGKELKEELDKSDYYGLGLPMGWISPKGDFHEMGSHDDHHAVIGDLTGVYPENEDDYDTSKEHAYNNGWISVGHSGEFNFQGHKDVLANRNHPAMKTMRSLAQQVAEQHPNESHVEAYAFDPKTGPSVKQVDVNHFTKHGTIKQAIVKSELTKHVRSPRKGHTIAQLERLKADNWHNPDTGTEISEGEGEAHLQQMHQNRADKKLKGMIKPKATKPSGEKPEDWFGKAMSPEEISSAGYSFKILNPTKAGRGFAVRAYHGKKPIGHLVFSPHAHAADPKSDSAHKNGYHSVSNGNIDESHRGKGLYQNMIKLASQHAKSLGSKGVYTSGYQRSGDATRAWDKVATHGARDNSMATKTTSRNADYFLAASETASLQKMSRPRLKFPGLGIDPRPDANVRILDTPRQKKIYGRVTANAKFPDQKNVPHHELTLNRDASHTSKTTYKDFSNQAARDKEAKKVASMMGTKAAGLSFQTNKRNPGQSFEAAVGGKDTIKFKNHENEDYKKLLAQKVAEHNERYKVWHDKYKELVNGPRTPERQEAILNIHNERPKFAKPRKPPARALSNKDATPEQRTQRSRSVDTTTEHEAAHRTFRQIENKYGRKYADDLKEKILNQFPEESRKALFDWARSRKYSPKDKHFKEEMITHARDLLTDPKARVGFEKLHGQKTAEHIKNIKAGWEKAVKLAREAKADVADQKDTPSFGVAAKKSESLNKSGFDFTKGQSYNSSMRKGMDKDYHKEAESGYTVLVPASVGGLKELSPGIMHHITVKMFKPYGKEMSDVEKHKVKDLMSREHLPTPNVKNLKFKPATFKSSRNGKVYHSLSVLGMPQEYYNFHNKYKDMGQTHPEYMPHITISEDTYNKIVNGQMDPQVAVGTPYLMQGSDPIMSMDHSDDDVKKSEVLAKAPIEYEPSLADEHAKQPFEPYEPEMYQHIAHTPLKGGLHHHVFHFGKEHDTVHHLTNSAVPGEGDVIAELSGDSDEPNAPLKINQAGVSPEFKGKGFGKKLYQLALLHHGKIYSDELVSNKAHKAWQNLQAQGANVKFGAPDTRQRHEAVATPEVAGQMKQKLAASEMKKSIPRIYSADEVVSHFKRLDTPGDHQERCEVAIRKHPSYVLGSIHPETTDHHYHSVDTPQSKQMVSNYSRLNSEAPPIVVAHDPEYEDQYKILDGVHRTKAAIAQGKSRINAFIPVKK